MTNSKTENDYGISINFKSMESFSFIYSSNDLYFLNEYIHFNMNIKLKEIITAK